MNTADIIVGREYELRPRRGRPIGPRVQVMEHGTYRSTSGDVWGPGNTVAGVLVRDAGDRLPGGGPLSGYGHVDRTRPGWRWVQARDIRRPWTDQVTEEWAAHRRLRDRRDATADALAVRYAVSPGRPAHVNWDRDHDRYRIRLSLTQDEADRLLEAMDEDHSAALAARTENER